MTEVLTIDVINNTRGGHGDLLFSIPDLIGDMEFDTYYLALAIEPKETTDDIKYAVSELMQFWIEKISEMKSDETIFLPIDFSDEYTGCLKVRTQNESLVLTYGFSRRAGYAVNPLNPGNYYKEITDFEASAEKQIIVAKSIFISTLERQIRKLQGQAI